MQILLLCVHSTKNFTLSTKHAITSIADIEKSELNCQFSLCILINNKNVIRYSTKWIFFTFFYSYQSTRRGPIVYVIEFINMSLLKQGLEYLYILCTLQVVEHIWWYDKQN
jgi:hypothetical protein